MASAASSASAPRVMLPSHQLSERSPSYPEGLRWTNNPALKAPNLAKFSATVSELNSRATTTVGEGQNTFYNFKAKEDAEAFSSSAHTIGVSCVGPQRQAVPPPVYEGPSDIGGYDCGLTEDQQSRFSSRLSELQKVEHYAGLKRGVAQELKGELDHLLETNSDGFFGKEVNRATLKTISNALGALADSEGSLFVESKIESNGGLKNFQTFGSVPVYQILNAAGHTIRSSFAEMKHAFSEEDCLRALFHTRDSEWRLPTAWGSETDEAARHEHKPDSVFFLNTFKLCYRNASEANPVTWSLSRGLSQPRQFIDYMKGEKVPVPIKSGNLLDWWIATDARFDTLSSKYREEDDQELIEQLKEQRGLITRILDYLGVDEAQREAHCESAFNYVEQVVKGIENPEPILHTEIAPMTEAEREKEAEEIFKESLNRRLAGSYRKIPMIKKKPEGEGYVFTVTSDDRGVWMNKSRLSDGELYMENPEDLIEKYERARKHKGNVPYLIG